MIVSIIPFLVGGTSFTVTASSTTTIPGLDKFVDTNGYSGFAIEGNVTQAVAGGSAKEQCSPDGSSWTDMASISLAAVQNVVPLHADGTLDPAAIPAACRDRLVHVRSQVIGTSTTGTAKVGSIDLIFVR